MGSDGRFLRDHVAPSDVTALSHGDERSRPEWPGSRLSWPSCVCGAFDWRQRRTWQAVEQVLRSAREDGGRAAPHQEQTARLGVGLTAERPRCAAFRPSEYPAGGELYSKPIFGVMSVFMGMRISSTFRERDAVARGKQRVASAAR